MSLDLDKGVIPLVEYFNNQGLTTIMSCEGHDIPNMSMFWIQFSKDITLEDITNWMKKHLNKYGCFCSCGRFTQRFFILNNNEIVTSYQYMAANQEAADKDLEKWKEEDKWH